MLRSLALATIVAAVVGAEPAHDCAWTLGTDADLDQKAPCHFTSVDRVGAAGADGDLAWRALKAHQYQIEWTMPAFDCEEPDHGVRHPFYLSVRFRDIAAKPIAVWSGRGGEGLYGKAIAGWIGGSGDGAWKEETIEIARSLLRSADGLGFSFSLTQIEAAVPIASMRLFAADATLADRDERIAGARALIASRRAVARAAATKVRELPLPQPGAAPEPTAAEAGRGFRVFFPSISRRLYANSQPRPDEAACALRACPGETRSLLVAVRALQDLGEARLTLTDATAGGQRIPLTNATVRWARYALLRAGSSWAPECREAPMRLALGAPELRPDHLAIACVTVRVPADARAGDYRGSLVVGAAGGGEVTVPIAIAVLPFALEEPDHATHGMFYYCDYGDASPYDLADMRDHGIDQLVAGFGPRISAAPGHALKFDVSGERAMLARMRALGFRSPLICNTGSFMSLTGKLAGVADGSDEHRRAYASAIAATLAAAKAEGFERTAFFPVDEPHDPKLIAAALRGCAWTRDVPEARTYITSNPKAVETLQPVLDDVAYNLVYLKPQAAAAVEKAGATTMFYTASFGADTEGPRFRAGFYLAKVGAESVQFFAYSDYEGDPFLDFDGGHRDWAVAYPSMDSCTHDPTLAWEALREGVDDFRYAYTLRARAARARAHGRAQAADAALAALDHALARVEADGSKAATPEQAIEADVRRAGESVVGETGERLAGGWYEATRAAIADAIAALGEAPR